jgi:hypothetical protein
MKRSDGRLARPSTFLNVHRTSMRSVDLFVRSEITPKATSGYFRGCSLSEIRSGTSATQIREKSKAQPKRRGLIKEQREDSVPFDLERTLFS